MADPQAVPAIETRQIAAPTEPEGAAPAREKDLLSAYTRLQEQYRRCTVALANAAHDLKTPLAIMAGYLELLLSEKPGALSERQRQILQDIHISRQRLHILIQNFLEFSTIEAGKLKMKFEAGDLNACLSEVCSFWMPRFQEKGVAFYFLANDRLEPIAFDYHKVQRVVSNLIENALKFTPPSGTVWLNAEPHIWERRNPQKQVIAMGERRQRSEAVPNAVRVCVADTGPGIAAEYHQEIFDEFVRLPAAAASGVDGTGLGLAIARRLVHAHRGKIWVESDIGCGTKVSFLLPNNPQ